MFKRTKRAAKQVGNSAKRKRDSFVEKNGPRNIMNRARNDANEIVSKLNEDEDLAHDARRQIKSQQVIILKVFGLGVLGLLILWVISILASI